MLYVYGLVDPNSHRIAYIGLSNNPQKRFQHHLSEARRFRERYGRIGKWLAALDDEGKRPELVLLDEGDDEAMRDREAELIREYRLSDEEFCTRNHRDSAKVSSQGTPFDIRALREARGLSQSAFARLIGVSASAVNQWEQGKRTPTGLSVQALELFARQNADYRDKEINVGVEGKHIADIPGGFIYDASAPNDEEE